jgi:hypothetical protein
LLHWASLFISILFLFFYLFFLKATQNGEKKGREIK